MAKKTVTSSMEFLRSPNASKMNDNIFVVLEEYLHSPSQKLAARIKRLSHDLTNSAYEEAKRKYPNKYQKDQDNNPILDSKGNRIPALGGEEYHPILMEKVQIHAQKAMDYSIRMIANHENNANPYVFRLSQAQEKVVYRLIGELLAQKGKNSFHPDGLIFAFDGYIERTKTNSLKCLEGKEAAVYDHNVQLYLKTKELVAREDYEAANVLSAGCARIKNLLTCPANPQKYSAIKEVLGTLHADPVLQDHRGLLKTLLANFILLVSGIGALYLAATREKRGTFFYRPNTDTENKVTEFEDVLSETPVCN